MTAPHHDEQFLVSSVGGGLANRDIVTFTEGAPQLFTVCIINTTGGALGAATWSSGAAGFKLGAAWTQPATGFRRYITFMFDPVANRAYEISRSAADVAN